MAAPTQDTQGESADVIQLPKLVSGEYEFDRREIVLKLVEAFRADDDRGYHGFAKSHASESRAGLHPCAFAVEAVTSRIFQVRSLSTMGKSY
jgi:hypothetical protein